MSMVQPNDGGNIGYRTNIAFLWTSHCTYENPERVLNKRIIIIMIELAEIERLSIYEKQYLHHTRFFILRYQ